MKWVIAPNSRLDFKFYFGINCSGTESFVRVFPRKTQGEVGGPFSSFMMAGWPGVGIYLCTSDDEEHWMDHPWRCVRITRDMDNSPKSTLVRVHDLDLYNDYSNLALPVGAGFGFIEVERPEDGKGFTFGSGAGGLKGRIQMIRVFKHQD